MRLGLRLNSDPSGRDDSKPMFEFFTVLTKRISYCFGLALGRKTTQPKQHYTIQTGRAVLKNKFPEILVCCQQQSRQLICKFKDLGIGNA